MKLHLPSKKDVVTLLNSTCFRLVDVGSVGNSRMYTYTTVWVPMTSSILPRHHFHLLRSYHQYNSFSSYSSYLSSFRVYIFSIFSTVALFPRFLRTHPRPFDNFGGPPIPRPRWSRSNSTRTRTFATPLNHEIQNRTEPKPNWAHCYIGFRLNDLKVFIYRCYYSQDTYLLAYG